MGAQQDGFGPSQRGGRRWGRPQPDRRGDRGGAPHDDGPGERPGDEGPGDDGPGDDGPHHDGPHHDGPHHEEWGGDDYGPVQRGGPGGRVPGLPTRVPTRGWLAAAAVVVAAVVAYGLGLAAYTSLSMERTDVSGLSGAGLRLNVLVVGKDSREGLTPEQLQALGTEQVGGERPDTVLLMALRGGRAALLSFPRDLLVTQCDGQRGRLNGAYAAGGPSCLVQTVTDVSDIPVTHYVEVNFLGFMNLVDALGGVEVRLDAPMADRAAGIDLPAGCVQLDGRQAIGFVRAREGGSDLERVARQQRFLGEVADELAAPSTLLNPVRLFRVAGAAGQAVTADEGLGTVDLLRIARGARGFAGGGMATHTVPATSSRVGGASVLVPQDEEAEALYARFRDGSVLAGEPEPAPDQPDDAPDDQATPAEPSPETPAPGSPEEC